MQHSKKPTKSSSISIKRKIVYCLAIVPCMFLFCEVALRLFGFCPLPPPWEWTDYQPPSRYFWLADCQVGYRNRPNGRYVHDRLRHCPVLTTDEDGFRNGFNWPGDPNTPIVLVLGDSFMFAGAVNDNETGPSAIASCLHEDGYNVRVLNAGVESYNIIQIYRMMQRAFSRYGDKIVGVVYAFCPNDTFGTVILGNAGPIPYPTARINEKGELVVREIEKMLVPAGCDFRHLARDRIATRSDWLSETSVLYNRGRIVINRYFGEDNSGSMVLHNGWAVVRHITIKMKQMCQSRDVFFITTNVGLLGAGAHEATSIPGFITLCELGGIRYVPFLPHLSHDRPSYHPGTIVGGPDCHYNAKGLKIFGEVLASVVEEYL